MKGLSIMVSGLIFIILAIISLLKRFSYEITYYSNGNVKSKKISFYKLKDI